VDELITDRVGNGRVTEVLAIALRVELAREDRRADAVAVFEDLEDGVRLLRGEW
jgi:hypothetical protein